MHHTFYLQFGKPVLRVSSAEVWGGLAVRELVGMESVFDPDAVGVEGVEGGALNCGDDACFEGHVVEIVIACDVNAFEDTASVGFTLDFEVYDDAAGGVGCAGVEFFETQLGDAVDGLNGGASIDVVGDCFDVALFGGVEYGVDFGFLFGRDLGHPALFLGLFCGGIWLVLRG